MADHPTMAITAGDPCGIGPEVVLKALEARPRPSQRGGARPPLARVRLVVIGDHTVFEETAKRHRIRLPAWEVVSVTQGLAHPPRRLVFLDCDHRHSFILGRSSREAGAASLAYLDQAIALWRMKRIQGLVTAPVTKWAIARAAPSFVGQTEYLAQAMRRRHVLMMFVSDHLRVALLTRHIPLSRVPRAITPRLVETAVHLAAEALRTHFHIPHPRLALCGLNPHAGEGSRCGTEEQTIMRPVLRKLRRQGIACEGPFAADGFFAEMLRSNISSKAPGKPGPRDIPYDAVICHYHDQGLIPFKMAARDQGCQLSVGLPIVRTSPDHGSGLDIAGQGIAHPGSMRYALRLAARLVQA